MSVSRPQRESSGNLGLVDPRSTLRLAFPQVLATGEGCSTSAGSIAATASCGANVVLGGPWRPSPRTGNPAMKIKYLALALLTTFVPVEAAAQSSPPRKDIPAIVKGANGAIVTIIALKNDKPITTGTGFLVSPDGMIVTNYHVIEAGNVAIVKFPDGTILPVDGVLAADKVRDLAVIKVGGKTFRTLPLGNSDRIQVGEDVVAIGNPLGLELTVSNGIISGLRDLKNGKFLQTTAPISPGSSGGPLFNMFGVVVGINSMYLEGGENLNFAIPVNDAKHLLKNQFVALHSLPNEQPSENATHAERNEDSNDLRYGIGWLQAKTGRRELNSDELRETLQWMRDTLPQGSLECLQYSDTVTCFKAELHKISGCTVELVTTYWRAEPNLHGVFTYFLDLGNVDSERIFSKTEHDKTHEYESFYLYTWNDTETILHINAPANDLENQLSFALTTEYSVRFNKAFRHAVELCGGRPSTVKF
jgi:S1-C subfamily serine protease